MNGRVLLLNATGQPLSMMPLSTVSWQRAVKDYYLDKITILESYENITLRSANEANNMPMPSVVMLKSYHRLPRIAKFTRKNMYLRDQHECQYCAQPFPGEKLTIDHVIPRSLGGGTSWENCVTACKKCNSHKGSKLIKPIREPVKPTWHNINSVVAAHGLTVPHRSWLQYIDLPEDNIIVQE